MAAALTWTCWKRLSRRILGAITEFGWNGTIGMMLTYFGRSEGN
ncbi:MULTISPECIES: hypothetical protein [unclassified Nonomuraea]